MTRMITAALCILLLAGQAMAEETRAKQAGEKVKLASYNDLVRRVEALETVEQPVPQVIHLDEDYGYDCGQGCASGGCARCRRGRWYAMYESVIVAPYQTNNTAIIAQNEPRFQHVGFDWDLEHSPRVELGYLATCGGLGWRARYWQFDHNSSFAIASDTAPLDDDEGFIGYGSVDSDIIIGAVDVDEGVFTSSIELDVIDLEAQVQRDNVRYSAGLRYAQVEQDYASDNDETDVFGNVRFKGLGPTVALEISRSCPYSLLNWFANVRGSILGGEQDFIAFDEDDDNYTMENDNAIVAVGEVQVGLEYRWCNLFVRSAVEAQYWANVGGANPTAVFGTNADIFDTQDPRDDALGFVGLSVGAGFNR